MLAVVSRWPSQALDLLLLLPHLPDPMLSFLGKFILFPSLWQNLISNTELDKQGIQTVSANEVKKFLLNGIEVMRSRVIGGLWIMGLIVNYPDAMLVPEQAALLASEDLSHHRLCHLSHAGMLRLASMVDGFVIPVEQQFDCASCVAGKLTWRPFPRSMNERAAKPLWLLHIDFLIIN